MRVDSRNYSKLALAIGAWVCIGSNVHAQSMYTIANPLMSKREVKVDAKPGAAITREPESKGMPKVRLVNSGGAGAEPSPLVGRDRERDRDRDESDSMVAEVGRERTGSASVSGLNAVRDELGLYTAVAIMQGSEAVLRTNVGRIAALTAANAQGGSGAGAAASAGAQTQQGASGKGARSTPFRQEVLRVSNGQSLYVNGKEIVPYVRDSQVDFAVKGQKTIFYSVVLDSETPPVYAQKPMEPIDIGFESRRMQQLAPEGGLKGASVSNSGGSGGASRP